MGGCIGSSRKGLSQRGEGVGTLGDAGSAVDRVFRFWGFHNCHSFGWRIAEGLGQGLSMPEKWFLEAGLMRGGGDGGGGRWMVDDGVWRPLVYRQSNALLASLRVS